MKETEPVEQSYKKTQDYVAETGGSYLARGSYRIQVYEKPGAIPIVLAAEEATTDRPRGVATVTQYLAAAVLATHFSRRLWEEQPMRWIEEEAMLQKKKEQLVERRSIGRSSSAPSSRDGSKSSARSCSRSSSGRGVP